MSIMNRIEELARPVMVAFQSDLEHDRAWIKANPGTPFIHVTRHSGTQCIPLPNANALLDDSPVPHLFGEARPSEIIRQTRALLHGALLESGKLWLYCDGHAVRKSNAQTCQQKFDEATNRAVNARSRQQQRDVIRRRYG